MICNSGFLEIHGNLLWKRKSYSQLQVSMTRMTLESFTVGQNYYITNKLGIIWLHKFGYKLAAYLTSFMYANQYNNGESEYIWSVSPYVVYRLTNHFNITSRLVYMKKKSTDAVLNFDNFMGNISLIMKY